MSATVSEQAEQTFPPKVSAVSAARRFATGSTISEGVDAEALALAVSELATNAVMHAGTPFVVSLERLDDGVRVSVTDEEPSLPEVRDTELSTITGRGLAIVGSLARVLRIESRPVGKTVSFELGWSQG